MVSSHLLGFLQILQDEKFNNVKWMHANKDLYTLVRQEFIVFCEKLLEEMKKIDLTLNDVQIKEYLFRINKDVRFSKDKKPYKTNWSCLISPQWKNWSTKNGDAGYYLHIEPGNKSMIWGGIYNPPIAARNKLRTYFAENYKEVQKIFSDPQRKPLLPYLHIDHWYITKKYIGHPAKELALIKNLYVMYPLSDKQMTSKQALKKIIGVRKVMVKFHQFLNGVVGE